MGCKLILDNLDRLGESVSASVGQLNEQRSTIARVRGTHAVARSLDPGQDLAGPTHGDGEVLGDVERPAPAPPLDDGHGLVPPERQVQLVAQASVDQVPQTGLYPHQIAEQPPQFGRVTHLLAGAAVVGNMVSSPSAISSMDYNSPMEESPAMAAEDDIRALLGTYETSLNTSDASLAASCYTTDGVFMPTTLPTASGAAITAAYENIFAAIKLDVVFAIDELVVASDELAYALTRSSGTQTVLANDAVSAEANREVFILRRENDAWKIARYMFNKSE